MAEIGTLMQATRQRFPANFQTQMFSLCLGTTQCSAVMNLASEFFFAGLITCINRGGIREQRLTLDH